MSRTQNGESTNEKHCTRPSKLGFTSNRDVDQLVNLLAIDDIFVVLGQKDNEEGLYITTC